MFLSGDFFFLFETLKNKTPFDELSFTLQYKNVKNKNLDSSSISNG